MALGVYPAISLADAREWCQEARKLLASGIDPGAQKRAEKLASVNSFEAVARSWLDERGQTVEPKQNKKIQSRLENDVFSWLGRRPIVEIDALEILSVLKRVDARGARYTAHRP